MKNKYYPHLADPITINGVTFRNRVFGAPLSSPELDPDCHLRKEDIAFHANRVRGGLASACIGLGIVDAVGRTHTKEVILYDNLSLPSLKECADAIHRNGGKAVMELAHGGKYAGARSHEKDSVYALSSDAGVNADGVEVRSMTDEEIYHAAECFGNAAKLCQEAGWDMVLVHGGHGWLLGQFMSPTMNHRTDKWGGSLENRMRFPLLVIEKIREACGPAFPIEYRMSGAELIEGGYGIEEGIGMAKALDGKVDIIHVSAGIHEDLDVFTLTHPSMFVEHGCNVYLAAEVKKHVKTPVATLGGINDPDMMEEIIASGKADIVEIARQSMCDEFFVDKAFSGRKDDITKCCRCYTCFYNYLTNRTFCCAFNPVIGHEFENQYGYRPTTPKKVVVVGGGPGGMEAAITAAARGHEVTLFEKEARLGGQLNYEENMPFKADMFGFARLLEKRVVEAGVKVVLNKAVTPEEVAALNADVVITAIGAAPVIPPIPGIDSDKVMTLKEFHAHPEKIGENVVVLGAGLVGCECSIYLDSIGKNVTIVEMKDDWAADSYWMHKQAMDIYLRDSKVQIFCKTKAKEVTGEGLLCETPDGEKLFKADTIFVAAGMKADKELANDFYNTAPRVFQIGDCGKVGRVVDAVTLGYYRALDI